MMCNMILMEQLEIIHYCHPNCTPLKLNDPPKMVHRSTNGERGSEGYKEYAVVRPDNWGWGGGDNKSSAGNDIVYTKSDENMFAAETTPTYAEIANQSVMTVTIERVAGDITVTFDIVGDNGSTIQTTAKVTDNFADDVTLFMCADGSYCKVMEVK